MGGLSRQQRLMSCPVRQRRPRGELFALDWAAAWPLQRLASADSPSTVTAFGAWLVKRAYVLMQQALGIEQIFQHGFASQLRFPVANQSENAFVPLPVFIPVIDEWQYNLSGFGCRMIEHTHGGLNGRVTRRLRECLVN